VGSMNGKRAMGVDFDMEFGLEFGRHGVTGLQSDRAVSPLAASGGLEISLEGRALSYSKIAFRFSPERPEYSHRCKSAGSSCAKTVPPYPTLCQRLLAQAPPTKLTHAPKLHRQPTSRLICLRLSETLCPSIDQPSSLAPKQGSPTMEDPWADSAAGTSQQPSSSQPDDSRPVASSAPGTASSSTPSRASRLTPRRLVAQPTRLQAVEDDPLGPLGPLGAGPAASDPQLAPPAPPVKEQLPLRTTLPVNTGSVRRQGPPDPHQIDVDDDAFAQPSGPRQPPPVLAAQPSPVRSTMQPSVSVEQAAKPNFHITVGDPHKVGDLTSSHIVYSVRTKVCVPFRGCRKGEGWSADKG
jgi:hypothetical protein